jgi:ribose 5-phosphate isomerase RpiB
MNPQDIEKIVMEVVRRLQQAAAQDPCQTFLAESNSEQTREPTSSLASLGGTSGLPVRFAKTKYTPDIPATSVPQVGSLSHDVLICEDRLLTLAKVEAHLNGLRRIIVDKKAVVTPALREELSRRNIVIERGGSRPGTNPHFAVSVIRFMADHAPALHGLGLAEDVQANNLSVLTNAVQTQLASGNRHVIVLTPKTSVVLCMLNRLPQVRAATAQTVEAVKGACQEIAANVLVVNPAKLGRVQLAGLLRAFENEGLRAPSSELTPHL